MSVPNYRAIKFSFTLWRTFSENYYFAKCLWSLQIYADCRNSEYTTHAVVARNCTEQVRCDSEICRRCWIWIRCQWHHHVTCLCSARNTMHNIYEWIDDFWHLHAVSKHTTVQIWRLPPTFTGKSAISRIAIYKCKLLGINFYPKQCNRQQWTEVIINTFR